ncbi:ACT domain-containing protein [Paraglaciecola hydrolytica]|uniref:CASTOR ACT domain-containing protein n=1 Tax=Paraglaciecola hydrolytica TaxID=1799789 RepID=A0A148KMB9_9ALTE|nr:ACT domain-containing protein [Paraglaciecola hydrolytica]KXI27437.1 hypothetical protein AX660_22240 [Paraglaciecola hydrolytica]
MAGETDLALLLTSMSPSLAQDEYVFTTVTDVKTALQTGISPKAMFVESEGTTLVLTVADTQLANLSFSGTYRCITLNVHSSLEAIGLTAAVSAALTKANISANVIAAYYHDHIFVPTDKAQAAMHALKSLTNEWLRRQ